MKKLHFLTYVLLTLVLFGCTSNKQKSSEKTKKQTPFAKDFALYELAEQYGFKVGGCISYNNLGDTKYTNMLKGDFNTITATNEFKAYSMLSQRQSQEQNKVVISFTTADKICNFAQANGIGIRGHVLVWDAYMSDWFFREGFTYNGAYVDKATMEERLSYYIEEVITHFETKYPGLVYCWDVVNEAVADGANEWIPGNECHIRKTRSGKPNMFNEIMGPEYVDFSFKCARNTVNKLGADIKLFYNDYNTYYQDKRNAICNLVKKLNSEEKLCDGVGMQGYIGGYGSQNGCMNPGDLNLIKQAIKAYSDLGVEVQLTEVAVRNYDNSEDTMIKHASFYGQLFETLKQVSLEGANFTAITIWGLCDNPLMDKNDYSYKQNGPFCGLYNKYCEPKQSYIVAYSVLNR